MRLFSINSYTRLPDENEALRWPDATVARLEKLRRRTRWFRRRWSQRTVVLNPAGLLIVYRTLQTGRVYALSSARKVTISIKPQLALLHVVDERGNGVTLRVRGSHATHWATLLLRYATSTTAEDPREEQSVDIVQLDDVAVLASSDQVNKSPAHPIFHSVSRLSPTVQRNVSASSDNSSWTSLPSPSDRSSSDSSKITVIANVHPPPKTTDLLIASSPSISPSSEGTEETGVPKRSPPLKVIETMQQQAEDIGKAIPPTSVQTPREDEERKANLVRRLSAILQRQIDSEMSTRSSSTSTFSFSEFKTRGTVQIYRPPPSLPPDDRHYLNVPPPMLSPNFLSELRTACHP